MSTPTDPYNSGSRRPFDDDAAILDPIDNGTSPDDEQAAWDRAFESDGELDEPSPAEAETEDDSKSSNPTLGAFISDRHEPAASWTNKPSHTEENRASSETEEPDVDPIPVPAERIGPTRTSVMPTASDVSAEHSPDDTPHGPALGTPVATATTAPADPVPNTTPERREHWASDPGEAAFAHDIPEEPKGRGLAHAGTLLLTLLLVPVAWYLISDAGARLSAVVDNPWDTGSFQIFPFLELLGGFVVLAVIWLFARTSSLGAQVIGATTAIAGIVALVAPKLGNDVVNALDRAIGDYNDFTGNVVHHLGNDLGSGRIATFGLLLFLTGLVAHGARRRGQRVGTALTRRQFLLGDENTQD
ncbi:hypothetical protein J2S70_000828 [Trueperella bonasi]|uniref:Uncharacterized protein n=1 Tax=Trueperella bonasi TaxID=312286 RepID=A0ABT9NFS7_9ACTO|nr:hypothetical protein [Trueperella bonasi]MDP9806246.1 hypothetical protein [Trueperella bonasi]